MITWWLDQIKMTDSSRGYEVKLFTAVINGKSYNSEGRFSEALKEAIGSTKPGDTILIKDWILYNDKLKRTSSMKGSSTFTIE